MKKSSAVEWEESEERILKIIEEYMKKSPGNWLLDAGCGTGRLLPRFQKYFDKILAVDLDPTQIRKAQELAQIHGFANKVTFKTSSIDSVKWRRNSIDAVLCSHLLQHVSNDSVKRILEKFKTLSKEDSLLFIMTAHARYQDYFTKESLEGQEHFEERINAEEFDSLTSNSKNILPIHFFPKKSIQNALERSGFKTLEYRLFHKVAVGNSCRKESRDLLIVAKKL